MRNLIASTCLLGIYSISHASELPNLERTDRMIEHSDIYNAILDRDYYLALELSTQAALDYLRAHPEVIDNTVRYAMEKGAEKLQELSRSTSGNEQGKKQAIKRLIEESYLPYESPQTGSLAVSFKQSLEYGLTRISWKNDTTDERCRRETIVNSTCTQWDFSRPGQCKPGAWQNSFSYDDYWGLRQPNYLIYRTVNGNESLVVKLSGAYFSRKRGLSINDKLWSNLRSTYNFFNHSKIDLSKRVFYDDYTAPLQKPGNTISYRIVSDKGPFSGPLCRSSDHKESIAVFDSTGDGMADFIPREEYLKYGGGGIAALPAIMSILFN